MKNKIFALIVAGGSGKRLNANLPKQYRKVGNSTILERAINSFYNNELIEGVCVVISDEHKNLFKPIKEKYKNLIFCTSGKLRQDSVRLGLEKLKGFSPDYVLIHDAARPFVSEDIIAKVIDGLKNNNAVLPAVKVKDTIKLTDGGIIKETLSRENLFAAQTPQGFKFDLIFKLHKKYKDIEFTDDIALAEKEGVKIKIVDGDYGNYKITTEDDIKMAEMRSQKQTRVGNGFDVHEFVDGKNIILCGINIPYHKKLRGHSDADCAWHALTDALLGTIGLGDIGEHFPDSNVKWKGADSSIFLNKAVEEIRTRSGEIVNVDITIICEEPKLKIYKQKMKERTAEILGISGENINIKATTTEKLGFLGRKEGIAALATATVLV